MVQLYHGPSPYRAVRSLLTASRSPGSALLDSTAQLVDVFWGLYKWLDAHATETVVVSVKVDNGNSTASLQQTIYDLVTGQDVAQYWVQSAAVSFTYYARLSPLTPSSSCRHWAKHAIRRFSFVDLHLISYRTLHPTALTTPRAGQTTTPNFKFNMAPTARRSTLKTFTTYKAMTWTLL